MGSFDTLFQLVVLMTIIALSMQWRADLLDTDNIIYVSFFLHLSIDSTLVILGVVSDIK